MWFCPVDVRAKARTYPTAKSLLFDDGVIPVGEQLLLDRSSLRAIGKRAYLDMQEFVLRLAAHHNPITPLPQSGNQDIGIFLAGNGRDLHHRLTITGSRNSTERWA